MDFKKRPSWDEYFIAITKEVAKRSTCLRRSVGAVLVKDKRILSTGYNGAVKNSKHCLEIGCMRQKHAISSGTRQELCRGLHAEQNALLFVTTLGINTDHSILYCTNYPCSLCAKMLVQAGVKKVIYCEDYPDELAKSIFIENNIDIKKFTP
ncbi:MAG: cytidine/deoxycytidylate deaminase family protein [Elusimicrobiota bacterium]|jgi:dCMP deaminase|nr:cytidine/deoxycytidylate deaminase family protein [Elusimicrobiota bacterium]